MRNEKQLKEAISKTVTPQEQQALAFVSDLGLRNGIMSVLDGMRSKGKQIDLAGAAGQIAQVLQARGKQVHPDLQRLISRPKNVAKPINFAPGKKRSVPKPPDFIMKNSQNKNASSLEQTAAEVEKHEQAASKKPHMGHQMQALTQMYGPARNLYQPNPADAPKNQDQILQRIEDAISKEKPSRMRENKMIKTKRQLKEAAHNIILAEQKKRILKKVLKEQLSEQISVGNHAIHLLNEGPLSNVWGSIKSAGSAVGLPGMKNLGQDAAKNDQAQRVKDAINGLTKIISKAHQQRQKWNGQMLKSAEMMSQYHDAVVQAYELYKQHSAMLGPAGEQVSNQINGIIDDLQNDLMSEVSQIQAMIKSLGKKDVSLDQMLKTHQQDAEMKREREADLNPAGVTSSQRSMPSMRAGEPTPKEKLRKLRPQSDAKEEPRKSKKEEAKEQTSRVQASDQKAYQNYETARDEIEKGYNELSKDLTTRALRAKTKEERSSIVRQMYDLIKSKKERIEELENSLKGIGIRSKAGRTAAKKAYGKNKE